MSSRPQKKNACSADRKMQNRPYDSRPRSGQGLPKRHAHQDNAVRVIMPDEPPRLTPEVARVLLRILLKAREQLNTTDDPHGGDAKCPSSPSTAGCPPKTSKTPSRHGAGSSPDPAP